MKLITLQGINKGVGTSSIAAAVAYTLARLGKPTLAVDGDCFSDAGCLGNFFGIPKQERGWPQGMMDGMGLANTADMNVLYRYADNCFYLAGGAVPRNTECSKVVGDLLGELDTLAKLDYVIVDAGFRQTAQAQAFAARSDLALTVMACDGGSLYKLSDSEIADNEFLLINKLMTSSRVERDVQEMLRGSEWARHFIKNGIAFDEVMMESLMQQQPISRFLPVSSPAADIEKTVFELIRLCDFADGQRLTRKDSGER